VGQLLEGLKLAVPRRLTPTAPDAKGPCPVNELKIKKDSSVVQVCQ